MYDDVITARCDPAKQNCSYAKYSSCLTSYLMQSRHYRDGLMSPYVSRSRINANVRVSKAATANWIWITSGFHWLSTLHRRADLHHGGASPAITSGGARRYSARNDHSDVVASNPDGIRKGICILADAVMRGKGLIYKTLILAFLQPAARARPQPGASSALGPDLAPSTIYKTLASRRAVRPRSARSRIPDSPTTPTLPGP